MNNKKEILDFLREHKHELLLDYNLSKIGLFGSFSREEATQESDVDIIIDFKEGSQDVYALKTSLKAYLVEHFNRSVDLAREKYLKPYAKEQILRDTIYV